MRRRLDVARMRKYTTVHGLHARSPHRRCVVQTVNVGALVAADLRATWAAWWRDGIHPPEGTTLRWSHGWLTGDLPEPVTTTIEERPWRPEELNWR